MDRQGRRGAGASRRLSRREADPAALRLIERHGAAVLRAARRWSLTPEDAEDAYQRGLEILLTKAPAIPDRELLPWLKTVVKHEAFALRRGRERAGLAAADFEEPGPEAPVWGASVSAHEHVERHERLRVGAEALGQLKPQEVRCLLLLAQGHSYKQIQEITGWTYTKVNRCVSEGRRSFRRRVAGIESGAECDRLAPLLSAFVDGEATAGELALLRPHLRGCLSCRATVRDYRSTPARVAALVPPAALAGAGGESAELGARGLDGLLQWLHEKSALVAMRVHGIVELATAPKVAAVAASTAAIASGGAATVQTVAREASPRRAPSASKATSAANAVPSRPRRPCGWRRWPSRPSPLVPAAPPSARGGGGRPRSHRLPAEPSSRRPRPRGASSRPPWSASRRPPPRHLRSPRPRPPHRPRSRSRSRSAARTSSASDTRRLYNRR